MKILVLTHEFPPVGGGGGRVALDLSQGLAARGHDVKILTAAMGGLNAIEQIGGFELRRIGFNRRFAFRALLPEMFLFNLFCVWESLRLIKKWRPDVIHAHFAVPAGLAAWMLSQLTGIPYVLTAHLGDVPGGVPEKTEHIFRWILPFTQPIWRAAARVVAVSQFTKQIAEKSYAGVRVEVIHNGVDLSALPARQAEASHPPTIIFAGRFMEQKNPAHLVRALAELKDLSWQCVMLGDGPLLNEVQDLIKENNLQTRFKLLGWVSPDVVLAWFAKAQILCLPSRSEGLPIVGVQAMGMGMALVLSEAGGNVELVKQGENGFLFTAGDIAALADCLRILLSSPERLKLAQEKSLALAKAFDLNVIVAQYEMLFHQVHQKE